MSERHGQKALPHGLIERRIGATPQNSANRGTQLAKIALRETTDAHGDGTDAEPDTATVSTAFATTP